MKSLVINANIVDGIFAWNKLAIPMFSKGHWMEKAINAFIVHHFSKLASSSATPDNIAVPATTIVKPATNSNVTDDTI